MWAIKHVVSPLDRLIGRISRGRLPPLSSLVVPTLLLTTVGRRSGQERTIPLVYVRDGNRFLVANARPAGERDNPWVLNLRAAARGQVKVKGQNVLVKSRELSASEAEIWWPALVEVWPAFSEHYAATGDRSVFELQPVD
ncbi:MAG: nitroreductase/quinone reductase family protein [Acidimicrobiia bacterium]